MSTSEANAIFRFLSKKDAHLIWIMCVCMCVKLVDYGGTIRGLSQWLCQKSFPTKSSSYKFLFKNKDYENKNRVYRFCVQYFSRSIKFRFRWHLADVHVYPTKFFSFVSLCTRTNIERDLIKETNWSILVRDNNWKHRILLWEQNFLFLSLIS